jgi:hypothetical protein
VAVQNAVHPISPLYPLAIPASGMIAAETQHTQEVTKMPLSIIWEGIEITLSHTSNWFNINYERIEVSSNVRVRLPITKIGYNSYFLSADELALFDSSEDFVRQWLDQPAQSKNVDEARRR